MTKTNLSTEQKLWGAASYLWILSLVALAARKDDDFIRFHANQGVLIFAVSIFLMLIPMLGWILNVLLGITAIVAIIKSLQGERWELPIASDVAVKFGDWVIKTLKL